MSIPTGLAARFAAGASLPLRGLAYLAARRALWPYALLPVLLTLVGLVAGFVLALPLSGRLLALLWVKPEGLLVGAWWLSRAALYLVLVYVTAIALPAIVSAPFSDRLSVRVEALELGEPTSGGVARAAAEAWAGVAHALVRVAWLVAGHALLLPALFVPFAYPVLAFLWTARWTAVEYVDLPMSRNLHRLAEVRAALREVRPLGAGFGSVLAALLLVPFANLLVVPVGTIAGTLVYCDLVRAGHLAPPGSRPSPTAPERPAPGRRARRPSVLLAVLIGISILVVPSLGVLLYVAKSHVVYADSLGRLEASDTVQRTVGAPLRPSLWTYARIVRGSGTWRYSVAGPTGEADVVVSAKRRPEGGWRVEYILVKPEGAERSFSITAREPETGASRVAR